MAIPDIGSTGEVIAGDAVDGLVFGALAQAPFAALLFGTDTELTLLWRNQAHAVMSDSVGRAVQHMPLFEAFPPSDDGEGAAAKAAIEHSVRRIKESGTAESLGPYRYDLRDHSGAYVEHHWEMNMSPVKQGGDVVAILQVAKDVTREVLAARLSDSLKRTAQSTAAVSYFSYDRETDVFIRSPEVDAMFGFAEGEAGPNAQSFFARVHADDLPGVYEEVERVFKAPRGEIASFDYRVPLPDDAERFLRIRAEVATDPDDRREKLVGTFVDLTDLEENRQSLARALELQKALVSEANHRIKNSLAIATSMLRLEQNELQRRETIDPAEAAAALASAGARIRAISDAHGLMQMDQHRTSVFLKSLVERLATYARQSAGISEDELSLTLPASDIALDSDTAITLGMILNEIVTNALKYGVERNTGTDIRLSVDLSDAEITIVLENAKATNRRAMDIPSTKLGSMLVAQLTENLNAEIQSEETADAYRTKLAIPMSYINGRM